MKNGFWLIEERQERNSRKEPCVFLLAGIGAHATLSVAKIAHDRKDISVFLKFAMDCSSWGWETLKTKIGIDKVNEELDSRMNTIYNELQDLATVLSNNITLIEQLRQRQDRWLASIDQYERSVLHYAALKGNYKLLRCLVYAGSPLNNRDGIGQTPLTLALHKGNIIIAKWLIENGASIEEEFFENTVSPFEIINAKPELSILKDLITTKLRENANVLEHLNKFYHPNIEIEKEPEATKLNHKPNVNFTRSLNINVGDQKNTVNILGCINRCPDVYGVHTPGGGDFHNRGYLNESIARVAGHGGFWHVTERVLKRPTINPSSFKKKFKDNNFNNNEEALLDYDDGLSIAMIKEFQNSDFFPDEEKLAKCLLKHKSHNKILLKKFKAWADYNRLQDQVFAYHMDIVENLVPITRWYKESVRNGNGMAIEAVWMLCPPLYAQVGKTNYRDESFTQIVNAVAKWPLAYRLMYRQNRTVNLNGNEGRQLAGDEWVEGYLVAPVKRYAAAQTSFNMLEMMSSSVNILETNRKMYKSREAFDIHRTCKHHNPSSLNDQLRVCQFALKENFFNNLGRQDVLAYSWAGHECKDGEKVPSVYLKVLEKGGKKAQADFSSYLQRKHPNEML